MTRRLISHSEIQTAYDCQAKHSFAYTGHLTGGMVLKPHAPAARLRAGSAWGRGVAAFHQADVGAPVIVRYAVAVAALNASLDEDAARMREHGFYDQAEHHDMAVRLGDVLWHYATTAEPLTISDPEFELWLPIPSRSGRGVSNRYGFHGFLDGLAVVNGHLFIAEYKMRDQLSDFEEIANAPQYRRYVWATERLLDVRIAGIIVDECLSEPPKPARWVQAKRKGEGLPPFNAKGVGRLPSHAVDQVTTEASYRDACAEAGVPANEDTAAALAARKWSARHKVIYRRSEIEEAGRELVSAGHYIALLDSGVLEPVRNASRRLCGFCQFKGICRTPNDRELVDINFERKPPKRLREPLLEGSRT